MSPPILPDASATTGTPTLKELRAQRKIKDLEISNLSMLGVNKYLEKRLHHQQKEIAHLKALCARNEIADSAIQLPESDSDSDTGSSSGDDGENVDNHCSGDWLPPQSGIADTDGHGDTTSAARARERDAISRLNRAEKSHEMLRRCLQLSAVLLDSAKRSLEHTVAPSDVRVGGKVADTAFGDPDADPDTGADPLFISSD